MSFGPLLTARKESVCRATRRSPSARSAQPAVAMRHSEEKTTWVAMRNNGSSTTVRLSASSTMRRPRRRAAAQIGPTKTASVVGQHDVGGGGERFRVGRDDGGDPLVAVGHDGAVAARVDEDRR
jgi:hypothetical protein